MRVRLIILILLLLSGATTPVHALDVSAHPQIEGLIADLSRNNGFDTRQLHQVFARVQLRQNVIEAMQRPYEARPWHEYRQLFLTPESIANGAEFLRRYRTDLARAEQQFGVPAPIIVAILGIETRYGSRTGSIPVMDSLTTLVLQYPRRSKYFMGELRHFLLLTRDESLDPLAIKGSYAGAMGIPQFLASSYRHYAIDFDGDGRRDLINQYPDAIGSVANYLKENRWRRGDPVIAAIDPDPGTALDNYVSTKLRTTTTADKLRRAGIDLGKEITDGARIGLLRLEEQNGSIWRVAFENFYVITRYNQSVNYAMAVVELGDAMARADSEK